MLLWFTLGGSSIQADVVPAIASGDDVILSARLGMFRLATARLDAPLHLEHIDETDHNRYMWQRKEDDIVEPDWTEYEEDIGP